MPDRIRLTVDLDYEQGIRLRKNLEWGEQGYVFRKIVAELNDFVETYGKVGIAMYLSNQLNLLDIMKAKEKKNGTKGPKAKPSRTP